MRSLQGFLKDSSSLSLRRERINNQENRMEDRIQRMKELVSHPAGSRKGLLSEKAGKS